MTYPFPLGPLALAGTVLALTAAQAFADETVMILEGGIAATLNMPDGAVEVPAVLLLHGFGSSRDEVAGMYSREAAALAERGIASLRIDFRGFGKSDGDTGATTIDGQLADATTGLGVLAATESVDAGRLGVLGFSLGGGVAALLAAGHPDEIKALATWSSVGDFDTDMFDSVGQAAVDRAMSEGVVGLDLGFRTIVLKDTFFESLKNFDIAAAIASYPGAYLSITGDQDFSSAYAAQFAETSGSAAPDVRVLPGADHIYGAFEEDQTLNNSVVTQTADWFAENL